MNKLFTVLLLFLSCQLATAQEYYVKQYRVEKGLPSDIVKGCIQDSLGYFWVATDEGLVKYDGIKFTSYREAMHGNYAKGFFKTKSGRLLAYGDLDLIEIENQEDTVIFERICPVARIANDSTLSYPKLVYEDVNGAIWISESQSVVRLGDNSFKRYEFDIANRTPGFLRSFAFFEDRKHSLFVSSSRGNVFRYNVSTDSFEIVKEKFPSEVEFASVFGNKVLIGSAEGLSEAELLDDGGFKKPELRIKIPLVSFVAPIHDRKYVVATRGTQHLIADLDKNTSKIIGNPINNVNHVYFSKENDIWISGNDGLVLMRENLFQGANENVTDFIESITEDTASNSIYYAISHTMYAFDRALKTNRVLFNLPSGYFQSLISTPDGVWMANAFKVSLFANGKIKKEFDFSNYGRFVTAITRDSKGNIWLTIPGRKRALMIDRHLNLQQFSVPLGEEGVINMIREGDGGMYIASAGQASYLFFKPDADSAFHNISLPLNFKFRGDFNATELVVDGKDVWLATSDGLLKFDHRMVDRVNLGDRYTNLPIQTIHAYSGKNLLIANAFGMLLFDSHTGSYDLFNESLGLLSNTITPRGFHVDKKGQVWIGTAKGLCYSTRPLTQYTKTPRPRFTQIYANGKKVSFRTGNQIAYGSFLSVSVSSITFPENEAILQYRLQHEGEWRTTRESELQFSDLTAGSHTLEVRSKKNGLFSWSDPSSLGFTIATPFWQQVWFYLLWITTAIILIAVTYIGVTARNRQRNRELQLLIDERTKELKQSNEELVNLNLEKNNLIGIVAHDLKSPLSQIRGLLNLIKMTGTVDETSMKYLSLMETSTSKLNDMIGKILDVDAINTKQLNLEMEKVNLSEIFNGVADRFFNEATRKNIGIIRLIDTAIFINADKNYVEQVLENLLSNAIKFSPYGRNIYVNLYARDNKVICEIKDEGPGLSDEDKKKLFGKYQKLSARPTGDEVSTGLGLSIVKKFVEAMNGKIWLDSEHGNGASFFVSFPLY